MKKLLATLIFGFLSINVYAGVITVDPFISPDDVTITHLETLRTRTLNVINGNIEGGSTGNIKIDTVAEVNMADDANPRIRWGEAFSDFVYSGLLPPTSASLTSTTTLGTAYITGYRVTKEATSHTYGPSLWTFVDLSNTGVYTYVPVAIGAPDPAVTASSIRLARVSSDAVTINAVRDDRVLSIHLAVNEDPYRSGFLISVVTPDTITLSPGVTYHGTTRVSKTANTTLALGTATDWVDGVSARATNKFGYVVTNSLGNIKLTVVSPDAVDTLGNTVGIKRYATVSGNVYRSLAWFYMNTTGSGNIDWWAYGNIKDGDAPNAVFKFDATQPTLPYTAYTNIPSSFVPFYSTGKPIKLLGKLSILSVGGIQQPWTNISADGLRLISSDSAGAGTTAAAYMATSINDFLYTPTQGPHIYNLNYKHEDTDADVLNSMTFSIEEK